MLDLKAIRADSEAARAALARRGEVPVRALDQVLELDARRRSLLPELEELRAAKNAASKRIGELQREGEDAAEAIAEVRAVGDREKALDRELREVHDALDSAMAALPNLPDPDAADEDAVVREVGEAGRSGRDHLELLGDLVDLEAGARVAGARFAYLKGPLVLLELALVRWALEVLGGHGFVPVVPPVLVREEALYGTGFLPDTEQQIYRVPDDDLYLAGTSEVPLASLHAGEMLAEDDLPRRYAGLLHLLPARGGRRRQGHARDLSRAPVRQGRDVHVHSARGFPGRARAPAGDRGGADAGAGAAVPGGQHRRRRPGQLGRQEVRHRGLAAGAGALPGAHVVLEHDRLPGPPPRRALPPKGSGGPRHAHTLNGTAVAVGRTIIALVENGQQEDGSVVLPSVLREFGAPEQIAAVAKD